MTLRVILKILSKNSLIKYSVMKKCHKIFHGTFLTNKTPKNNNCRPQQITKFTEQTISRHFASNNASHNRSCVNSYKKRYIILANIQHFNHKFNCVSYQSLFEAYHSCCMELWSNLRHEVNLMPSCKFLPHAFCHTSYLVSRRRP